MSAIRRIYLWLEPHIIGFLRSQNMDVQPIGRRPSDLAEFDRQLRMLKYENDTLRQKLEYADALRKSHQENLGYWE